jgi:GNAT superfamily N-acetyltransferase
MHHANMAKIEEQPDGDNLVFRLMVAKREVCSAKIASYTILLDIQTTQGEEGKGYAKKLLAYIEKTGRDHNAVGLTTASIGVCNFKAVCFFKSMGYRLSPLKGQENSLEAKKILIKKSTQVSDWVEENLDKVLRPHLPSLEKW